jgi:dihydrolipoamide dehydrogenase
MVADTSGTEVLVVGGGPGGYVAAIRAGKRGLDATLVERDAVGGTCLNHGCIPSKALLSGADIAHRAAGAEHIGVHADPAIDLATMVEWKDDVVTRLTRGVGALCEKAGVDMIEGEATFTALGEATIAHADGTESTISFEHAVVATGSRPATIPDFAFDGENVISSKEALALESAPEALVVVGAGYIGMELATAFRKVGTRVTVLEMLPDALPGFPADATDVVRDRAADLGVDFHFGETAQGWAEEDDGVLVTTETEEGGTATYEGDAVLVAVGREPVTDELGLEELRVEVGEDGFVATDEEARTDVEDVYAVGDLTGEPMLAHAAMREGEVAADVIAGEPAALDQRTVPAAVFTDPEIGAVGMTEADAEAAGFEPVVGEMPLRASGRALTLDDRDGFVRIVADAEDEFVLGARIVAPEASELIAEVGLAIEMGARLEDVAGTIHTHPTLSEAVREAAMAARGEAIHLP